MSNKLKIFIGLLVIGILSAIFQGYVYNKMELEDYSICMHNNPELRTLEELNEKCNG